LRAVTLPSLTAEQIRQGLTASGIQVSAVKPGMPTMEDVFMTLSTAVD
jgi:hypothetical protein